LFGANSIGILINVDEIRIFSPSWVREFSKTLIYCLKRKDLDKEEVADIIENILSKENLLNRKARKFVEQREYFIEEQEEKYFEQEEQIKTKINGLNEKIENCKQEIEELEKKAKEREKKLYEKLELPRYTDLEVISEPPVDSETRTYYNDSRKEISKAMLESIIKNGGSNSVKNIEKYVYEKIKNLLSQEYLKKTDTTGFVWRHNIHSIATVWRNKKGILKKNTQRGIWEITEKGRQEYERLKKEVKANG